MQVLFFFFLDRLKNMKKMQTNKASCVSSLDAGVSRNGLYKFFMPVNDVEKWPSREFFLEFWVQIGYKKAVNDQPCKFLTRNKSLSKESKSICWMISECIRHRSSFIMQIRVCLKAPV